jgi:hypothetical protein
MKKPSFHSTNVNPGESFNQPPKMLWIHYKGL